MKSVNTTVAATVSSILRKARPMPRSALLLLSGAGLIEGLAPSPAAATTLAGLTGRTATAITSTPAPPSQATSAGAGSLKSGQSSDGSAPAQSTRDFSAALAAIQAQLAAQANARTAAQAASSSVPNGLTTGGLQVASGLVWQGASAPTQSQSGGQTTVEVDQTAAQAILNWSTYNIGKNTTVYYNQTSGTRSDGTNPWVALNRVDDPSGVPSQILGQIKADGSVYVINRNGVVFGGSSQVNVHSLVASSLDITDSQFLAGTVNPSVTTGTVVVDPSGGGYVGTANSPVFANASGTAADIVVQPGAIIQTKAPPSVTAGGGTILLLGGNVDNAGSLIAPDGQVMLAAGTSAYLYDSIDSSVRGAMVNVLNGGTVTNEAGGYVSAPTGNITFAGMNLQQKGVLAASTNVNEAGSITLSAGDGLKIEATQASYGAPYVFSPHSTRAGTVTLAAGSLTTALPEEDGLTALDGQPQGQSLVRIEGETVDVLGGAMLLAPGAKVQLNASSDPLNWYSVDYPAAPGLRAYFGPDAGRVYVGDGATIDVAGLKLATASADEDAVQVNVRGNELRDDLAQQGGILTGANVWVNVHDLLTVAPDQVYTAGGLIEVSGWLGLTQRSIDQRLTTGGSVTITSTGDAILRPGSSIDISGGSILHQAGYVNTTYLLGADGQYYNINYAPAEMQYVSIGLSGDVTHTRWNVTDSYASGLANGKMYESGYIEGKSAGSLAIDSRQVELDSHVDASTVTGPYQRAAGSVPHNGTLTIGATALGSFTNIEPGNVTIVPAVTAPNDVFAGDAVTGLFPEDPNSPSAPRTRDPNTQLPPDRQQTLYIGANNFNQAQYGAVIVNGGQFGVAGGAQATLAPGGTLTVNVQGGVLIDGSIIARGGAVNINSGGIVVNSQGQLFANPGSSTNGIELEPGATIDVRGLWINDALSPLETIPLLYNGGNVALNSPGSILLDAGSLIDASSGGWVQANGTLKISGGLPVGSGGNISLVPDKAIGPGCYFTDCQYGQPGTNLPQTYPYEVVLDGTVRSYGFTKGGTLALAEPQIVIGTSGTSAGGTLALDPSFFTQGGFSRYQLWGYQGVSIAPGTDIELHGSGFQPSQAVLTVPTGGNFAAATSVGPTSSLVPPQPVDLILSAIDPFAGDVTVGKGAVIHTDPGATVALHAQRQLYFDGTIDDPAGNIYLDLYGAPEPSTSVQDVGSPSAPPYSNPGYDATQALWIGSDAQLFARGYIASYGDPATRSIANVVRGGGSVNINTDALDSAYYPDTSIEQAYSIPLGTVVAEAGARIDVSGAAGTILVPQSGTARTYASVPIVTGGGSVSIDASMGLLWNASTDAHGGGAQAAGGSLTIGQSGYEVPLYSGLGYGGYTQPVFELVVSQHQGDPAPGLTRGSAVPASLSGQLYFSVDQIEAAGFDNVALHGLDALAFNGDVNLHVADTLKINALNITATPGANVTLSAPYVDIGSMSAYPSVTYWNGSNYATALAGTANLTVNAGLIDMEGTLRSGASYSYTSANDPVNGPVTTAVSLPGFAQMSFNSSGDIRLLTQPNASGESGALVTQGDLSFTANQVYTTTGSTQSGADLFQIEANGPTSVVSFARNSDVTPAVPLSAASVLQIIAPTILQGGVLRAPMGQIIFGDPNNPTYSNVTLLPGSITSVSADGALIPWGQPYGTSSWIYGYSSGYSVPSGSVVATPPAKEVSFYGSSVDVRSGAVIDESGGGDLYGAQFVPGRTGSTDVLAGSQTFAIVPSMGTSPAPIDPQMQRADGGAGTDGTPVALKVGDQVYLSGIPGLAAGNYTLLPGHYALLPGGFRVTVSQSGIVPADSLPNQTLRSGSYEVLGYRVSGNTGKQDPLAAEFLVTPGSVIRQESQFDESTVGQVFAAQAAAAGIAAPALPADAGYLVLVAASSLNFQGTGDFSVGKGGRGGQADIVGTNLFITGSAADAVPTGDVALSDATLNNIGAQSLLVGGTRSVYSDTVSITPAAQTLEIAGDATLKAPEILLVATNSLTLDPGAQIDTTGFGALPASFPSDPKTGLTLGRISISGGSAGFLEASNGPLLPVTLPGAAGAGAGTVTFGAGAGVYSKDNLIIGTTDTVVMDPSVQLAAPTVDVTADVINIGDGTSGFTVNQALLNSIAQGNPGHGVAPTTTLMLSASTSINTYGSAVLGSFDASQGTYALQNLVLSAPLIQGSGAAGDVARIAAQQITLQGAQTAGTATSTGSGRLELDTAQLVLGPGAMGLGGYQATAMNASNSVTGNGTGVFNVSGDLTVSSPLITGAAKADTTLTAAGAVALNRPSGSAGGVEGTAAGLGAHLTVTAGGAVADNTDLEFTSGAVNFTGSQVGIDGGGVVDVAAAIVPFFEVVRITPAGSITLTAHSGDVSVASGSLLDMSGGDFSKLDRTKTPNVDLLSSDKGSDAGTLNILAAAGTAALDGTLKVDVVSGYSGGNASLNLQSGDAAALLAAVASFKGKQSLTLATGDINVGSIKANEVDLSASSGNLTVTGLIDASGPNGGTITLTAGHSLTVAGSAKLDAHATASDGTGGDVMLGLDGSSSGLLTLASGSSVDVSGAKEGGRLWLRAPQVGSDGVAIAPTSGVTVTGARDLTVEAVAVTDITANPYVDQALGAADAAATAYTANAATIETGLGSLASDPNFHLLPGIELRSSGDMTLLQNPTSTDDGIDLHTYRYNGEPMVLTLRAAGNLNINGSLSDGFDTPVSVDIPDPLTSQATGTVYAIAPLLPAGSRSATIRLVAGANLAAADPTGLLPLDALPAGEGSINLNAQQLDQGGFPIPSVVRTGTGDLTLAAGRDINFVTEFGVYTAGTQSGAVSGFTPPARQYIPDSFNFFGFTSYLGADLNGDDYDSFYPTSFYASYPTQGGNLRVTAQGNVSSSVLTEPNTNVTYAGSEPDLFWLWTQWDGTDSSNPFDQATWFINFGTYYQSFNQTPAYFFPFGSAPSVAAFVGLGALGGGNATVTVGGNLSNVDIAVPTTGRIPTGPADLSRAVIAGGGNLTVDVAGALDGGNLIAANGVARIRAGTVGPTTPTDFVAGDDVRYSVYTDGDMNLMIGDMTRVGNQAAANQFSTGYMTGPSGYNFAEAVWGLEYIEPTTYLEGGPQQGTLALPYGFFTSYTAGTSMDLRSGGGDVTLNGDYVPAVIDVTAVTGSLVGGTNLPLNGAALLYAVPEPDSQVDWLAGQDIRLGISTNGLTPAVSTSTNVSQYLGFTYWYAGTVANGTTNDISTQGAQGLPANLVQTGDPGTDHVYALNGSIENFYSGVALSTTKQTEIRAGLDINAPLFFLQNNNEGDVSVVEAGRDITGCPAASPGCSAGVFTLSIGGPGALVVQAGRNLLSLQDLGAAGVGNNFQWEVGIESVGNAYNANLPADGASLAIEVGVGSGPKNAAFINAYIDPATAGSTASPYTAELIDYMHKLTGETLSISDAVAAFRALTPEQQTPFIQQVYFAEITTGGRLAAAGLGAGGKGYDRAYQAIQTLFPGSQVGQPTTAYTGDLEMTGFSRIRTQSGGDIGIIVPGGDITLGFENQTPNLSTQSDTAMPGVLTLRGGNIDMVSDGSQIVAQSRVFTELGGDIMMWSTNGDVNAGKGKKTSIVTSPPQVTYDSYGNVTKSPVTPQTGGGIATLIGVPGVQPGDVDLFAPHGTVDAGDAGIRVSGNLYIAALQVANADNIQVQGKAVGLPPQPTTNLALTTASNAATEAQALLKPLAGQEARTAVTVEVTGFGGDDNSCSRSDTHSSECPK
jgi:filamentous hemagglutinin family protein